ncbi:hypothetical protein SAMN06265346_1376 [Flavobacterium hercynium]|nr:hypothetical protein SAMN06265346_1376 [Flavobacterium hercynium]
MLFTGIFFNALFSCQENKKELGVKNNTYKIKKNKSTEIDID